MHLRPAAKVNLTLAVGPRGRDGYHPLESVFLRVGLADELVIAFAPPDADEDALTVTGLPGATDEGNLVLRAVALARRALEHDMPRLVAHLDKRIPIGGGLGGGSSDGASALDAALHMWGAGVAPATLEQLQRELGSDVPFFARGGQLALVSGTGETVAPLPVLAADMALVLVTPPILVSTAQIYARFDDLEFDQRAAATTRALVAAVEGGDSLVAWADRLRDANDLWRAAVAAEPSLGALRDELERLSSRPWLMSGSGSTLFAIYPSADAAVSAARALVSAESVALGGAIISAVNIEGPDPLWRFP